MNGAQGQSTRMNLEEQGKNVAAIFVLCLGAGPQVLFILPLVGMIHFMGSSFESLCLSFHLEVTPFFY